MHVAHVRSLDLYVQESPLVVVLAVGGVSAEKDVVVAYNRVPREHSGPFLHANKCLLGIRHGGLVDKVVSREVWCDALRLRVAERIVPHLLQRNDVRIAVTQLLPKLLQPCAICALVLCCVVLCCVVLCCVVCVCVCVCVCV